MTAPSNANTSGLEVVAWRWRFRTDGVWNYQEARQHIPDVTCEPLVTAASAQARISELDKEVERWISAYNAAHDQATENGGRANAARDRATAAEARAGRLAKALRKSREGWANALELGLLPPQHEETARDLRDEADAALQQETQP